MIHFKYMLLILIIFNFYSCGSAPVEIKESNEIVFYNYYNRFKLFWDKSQNKSTEEKIKLWNEYVEGQYYSFYEGYVWNKNIKNWKIKKDVELRANLKIYESNVNNIENGTKLLQSQIDKIIKKYKIKNNINKLGVRIYIAPMGFFSRNIYLSTSPLKRIDKPHIVINSDIFSLNNQYLESALTSALIHIDYSIRHYRLYGKLFLNTTNSSITLFYYNRLRYKDYKIRLKPYELKNKEKILAFLKEDNKPKHYKNLKEKLNWTYTCRLPKYIDIKDKSLKTCKNIYSLGDNFTNWVTQKYSYPKSLELTEESIKREFKQYSKITKNLIDKKTIKFLNN